jgi:hypothetical protein
LFGKKSSKVDHKTNKNTQAWRRARAIARKRGALGLPTDSWWEEAFKLGVERVSATAALNSLDDAKKEGIVGSKTYDRLRQVYLEKLSAIEDKTAKWHKEFPTFSEPAARSKMMNELSEAVGQPTYPERVSGKTGSNEPGLGLQPSNQTRSLYSASPMAGNRQLGPESETPNARRVMIDELKGVLSSANSSLTKVPTPQIGRRASIQNKQRMQPLTPKLPEVPAPKVQNITMQNRNPPGVTSTLMELNREFLEEFKKLKKPGSELT